MGAAYSGRAIFFCILLMWFGILTPYGPKPLALFSIEKRNKKEKKREQNRVLEYR